MDEDELIRRFAACRTPEEMRAFVASTPEARELPFVRGIHETRRDASTLQAGLQQRHTLQVSSAWFFDCVAEMEVPPEIETKSKRTRVAPSVIRNVAARVARSALEQLDVAQARSDAVRIISRTLWNLGSLDRAEGARSEELEEAGLAAFALWHAAVDALLRGTHDAKSWEEAARRFRAARHDRSAELLEGWSAGPACARLSELPRRALNIATLRAYRCSSCDFMFFHDLWNYLNWRDSDTPAKVAVFAADPRCDLCGGTTVLRHIAISTEPELGHPFANRMLFYETHYGFILRAPPGIGKSEKMDILLEAMMRRVWPLRSPRDDRERPFVADLAYSEESFLSHYREAHVPPEEEDADALSYFYGSLLHPVAKDIRGGTMSLDRAVDEVARIVREHPVLAGGGLFGQRSLRGKEDDHVVFLTMLGMLNEATGEWTAAATTFANAAAEAAAVSRFGEAVWLRDRAERIAKTRKLPEDQGDVVRVRAAEVTAAMGRLSEDPAVQAGALEETVRWHRKHVSSSTPHTAQWVEARLFLAVELLYQADAIHNADLAAAERSIDEATAICAETLRDDRDIAAREDIARSIPIIEHAASRARGVLLAGAELLLMNLGEEDEERRHRLGFQHVDAAALERSIATLAEWFPGRIQVHGSMIGIDATLAGEVRDIAREAFEEARRLARATGDSDAVAADAVNLAKIALRNGNPKAVRRPIAEAVEHLKNSTGRQAAEALTSSAATLTTAGYPREAAPIWRRAYLEWARIRRMFFLDELRQSLAWKMYVVHTGLELTADLSNPDECFSIFETIKTGSLGDAIVSSPLRFSGANADADLEKLRTLEQEIARVFGELQHARQTPPFAQATDPRELRRKLDALEAEYETQKQRVLLAHPKYLAFFADRQPAFRPAAAMLKEHLASGEATLGVWTTSDDHVIAYGRTARAKPFVLRIPVLEHLRSETGRNWKSLYEFMDKYHEALRPRENAARFRSKYAAPLYRALMQPVLKALGDCDRLVISGHDMLHQLPWGTLFDGDAYLVERLTLRQLTSFALPPAVPPSGEGSIVIVADPDPGDRRWRLPAAAREGRAIEQIASASGRRATLLTGRDATWESLVRSAADAEIVHLACHAFVETSDVWHSSILLSTGGADASADYVTLERIAQNLTLASSLVVLAACSSGVLRAQIGEELVGFTRSLLYAGAGSVLSALWPISDRATAELMTCLYERLLRHSESRARALRNAQLHLLRHQDPLLRHPAAWGAFALFGR